MTRFQVSLVGIAMASGWYFAQLAASFPLVRWGCALVLLSGFVFLGVDALIDKAKAESQDFYNGSVLTVLAPHIGAAITFLFMICVGLYVGLS